MTLIFSLVSGSRARLVNYVIITIIAELQRCPRYPDLCSDPRLCGEKYILAVAMLPKPQYANKLLAKPLGPIKL